MIVTEKQTIGEKEFTHTYSDKYLFLKREDGKLFGDAMDIEPHTYTETDERIYTEEILENIPAEEAEKIRQAYSA